MIYDSMENLQRYMGLHPRLDEALLYLQKEEWRKLPDGRNELDGRFLFANVDRYISKSEKPLETHSRYVDIQCLAEGEEIIGVAASKDIVPLEAYNTQSDIAFWGSNCPYTELAMCPGRFLILFPEESHAPGLQLKTEMDVHKVVLKVLWNDEKGD